MSSVSTSRQRVLITGGTNGIGAAIAQRCQADGYEPIILDLTGSGAIHCDLSDRDSTTNALKQALASGPITRLVNNVGAVFPNTVSEQTVDEFDAAVALNLRSAFLCTQALLPGMRDAGFGRVVSMGRYAQRGWFGMFRPQDRAAINYAMEVMNITDLKNRHLEELSGGQRQRVYVAQGIAQGHEILVLDEPMTGLDLTSMRIIDDVIHAEVEEHGHSVILTTHDLDEAAAADYVILMDGRVIAAGAPEDVLTRKNLETAYGLGSLHEPADVNGTTVVELPECTAEGDAIEAEHQPASYGDRFSRYEAL